MPPRLIRYEEGTFPWFPKLTIQKPTSKGYFNILSKDGAEIYEYLNSYEENMQRKAEGRYIGKKRVVFTKAKDPLTGIEGYRFVGFFVMIVRPPVRLVRLSAWWFAHFRSVSRFQVPRGLC